MSARRVDLPNVFRDSPEAERKFFLDLAGKYKRELSLHKYPGNLWKKDEEGKDWSNVTEHCLMEGARAEVLSGFLGISKQIRGALTSAAILHDFYKKEEMRLTYKDVEAGGSGRGGALIAEKASSHILREAGFSEFVISLVSHISGDPLVVLSLKRMLGEKDLNQESLAHLTMFYVDSYTRGNSWAEPMVELDGKVWNELDRRGERNLLNPAYAKMGKEKLAEYDNDSVLWGMTRFEAAVCLGHLIEERFAKLLEKSVSRVKNPKFLPELVDACIRSKFKKNAA